MLPLERLRRLGGFGQADFRDGYVFEPATVDDLTAVFKLARENRRQVVLRGAGRSYGDAAIGAECLVADMRRMSRILSWDPHSGVVETEPGASLGDIWKHCLPDGWWLPVVSGTMHPTISGALAANIHGKNNYAAGCLGEHVLELDILAASGGLQTLTPRDDLFFAVIGSFGLLAPITRVKLQMKRVTSGKVNVLPISCDSWDDHFLAFEEGLGQEVDYMVSWIDCFATGRSEGRGIFHSAEHRRDEPDSLNPAQQGLPARVLGVVPKGQVWRFLKLLNRRAAMRRLNTLKFAAGRRERASVQTLAEYSFLLDYVPDWERAYAPGGLIQYQCFVPVPEAKSTFSKLVHAQQEAGLESFLGVMKRHRPDRFLLSHAVDGYSLALDFKVTASNRPRLWSLCHRMNDVVLSAGGRFYFAKDSTLRPEDARAFLGASALEALAHWKRELDPDYLLTSELSRRLQLP